MGSKGRPFFAWASFALAVAILGGVIPYALYREHGAVEAEAREQIFNQVKVVDENLSLRLVAANSALDSIRHELPWMLAQENGRTLANRRLQALVDAMIGVRSFVFMDADGVAVASNRSELIGQNYRDGERFQAIRRGADPASLHVSAPFETPLGVYAIALGKAVVDSRGEFGGAVLAILGTDFFETLLKSVRYTPDTRSSVAHGDGKVVFSTQDVPDIRGVDLSVKPDSFFNQHLKSGQLASVFTGVAASSGDERLIAVRTVRPQAIAMDKGLVLAVSRSAPAVFSAWREQAAAKIGLFGLMVLLGTPGMFLYQRRRLAYARLAADGEAERQQAEETLRASEVQFRTLFETMSEGFCLCELVLDAAGKPRDILHLRANPAFAHQTGLRAGEVPGRTAAELWPDLQPSWLDRYAEVVLTGEPAHFQARLGPSGRWLQVSAYRTPSERFAVLVSDVTERQQMLARLRQQAMVFSSTEEGVVITDAHGCVLDANPAFERITEYPLAELHGRNMRIVQSGRHDRAFYRGMWKVLAETGRWHGEIWNRRKGGDVFLEWISICAVKDDHGQVVNYVGTAIDISRMRHAQTELERLAHHDGLTDLPNRQVLMARLEHALGRARRHAGLGAVLFMDLDRFKQVNDSFGHKAGDDLLQAVASRIKERLRESDTFARLGGDEFVILLEDIAQPKAAATLAQDVVRQMAIPFDLPGGVQAQIGASVGIALFPRDGSRAAELVERADQALYEAKRAGRGDYRFYDGTAAAAGGRRQQGCAVCRSEFDGD